MKISQKILEIEALCENLLKKNTDGGLLKFKVLAFAKPNFIFLLIFINSFPKNVF